MLDPGSEAPAFTLENQDGEPRTLSSFAGSWLVLYFYPRANTPGCTSEATAFRDRWDAYAERGAAIAGVSDDPVEELAAFHGEYDLPFDLLSDPDGETARAYDSHGERTVGGRSITGTFRNTYVVDPDGRIARGFEDVSPDSHADKVLTALDELRSTSG